MILDEYSSRGHGLRVARLSSHARARCTVAGCSQTRSARPAQEACRPLRLSTGAWAAAASATAASRAAVVSSTVRVRSGARKRSV